MKSWERRKLIYNSNLSPSQTLVLLCLSEFQGSKDNCWPSYQTIGEMTRLSRRSVIRIMDSLCDKGIVTKQHRVCISGDANTNLYSVNWHIISKYYQATQPTEVVEVQPVTATPTASRPAEVATPKIEVIEIEQELGIEPTTSPRERGGRILFHLRQKLRDLTERGNVIKLVEKYGRRWGIAYDRSELIWIGVT